MLWRQTNIFFHGVAALAVMWLAILVTDKRAIGIFAGLVFALAPGQVAGVAWVGGRTDSQAALFSCLYLCFLVLYTKSDKPIHLFLTCLCFLLTAFTKEQTALLVFAAPAAERVFGVPSRKRLTTVCCAVGFMALVYAWPAHFFLSHNRISLPSSSVWIHRVGATLIHYVGLDLIPTPSGMMALSLANYPGMFWAFLGFMFGIAFLVGGVIAWKRNPKIGWMCLAAALAYLPISNVLPVPSLVVGPYRTAVLGVPLAVLLGVLFDVIWRRSRALGGLVAATYLGLSMFAVHWSELRWWDDQTLYGSLVQYDPRSTAANKNSIYADIQAKRFASALGRVDNYLSWILADPTWPTHVDRGVAPRLSPTAFDRMGSNVGFKLEVPEEIAEYIAIRGLLYQRLKSRDLAFRNYESAFALSPVCADAATCLGDMFEPTDPAKATTFYEAAVEAKPSPANLTRLGKMRLAKNRYSEAESLYGRATVLQDWYGDYWLGLARAQYHLGKFQESKESIARAESGILVDRKGAESLKSLLVSRPTPGNASVSLGK